MDIDIDLYVLVGPWAFGKVILAEEIRAANRVGWRAGRAPNDRTNAYLSVPQCRGLEGCMRCKVATGCLAENKADMLRS